MDTATGLTHLGARDYDPATARFISVDPLLELGKPQTLNGYTYAAANPLAYTDPSGLGTEECMTGVLTGCKAGVPTENSVYHGEKDPGNSTVSPPAAGGSCPSTTNPNCPGYDKSDAAKHDNALAAILSNWTSSTGCAHKGYDGRVCAALNGILASGGTIAAGPPAIAKRWDRILAVFADPNATPEDLDKAIRGMANFLKSPAALKMASSIAGGTMHVNGGVIPELPNDVQFGVQSPGLLRFLALSTTIGVAATGWSNYQGTGGNLSEAAVETGLDFGAVWASALVGAGVGTAIPIPVVGTAVGVTVGALVGIATTSVTNNAVDYVWHKMHW